MAKLLPLQEYPFTVPCSGLNTNISRMGLSYFCENIIKPIDSEQPKLDGVRAVLSVIGL